MNVEQTQTKREAEEKIADFLDVDIDSLPYLFAKRNSAQIPGPDYETTIAIFSTYNNGTKSATYVAYEVSGEFGDSGCLAATFDKIPAFSKSPYTYLTVSEIRNILKEGGIF